MSDGPPLSDNPFDYMEGKNGLVRLSFKGKVIMTLKGKQATKFLIKIKGMSEAEQQLLMAKVTGHFKHGNERVAKQKRQ